MTICMTMAASQPLLSIPRTEHETPALGEWITNRQADVDDCEDAGHTTSEELDPQRLHIERMDVVI